VKTAPCGVEDRACPESHRLPNAEFLLSFLFDFLVGHGASSVTQNNVKDAD
jgi:hypothetical protein